MRTFASLITVWDNKTHISSFITRQREMASFWFIWPWINRLHGRNYFDSFILTSTANTMKFSHIFTFETFSWLVFLALVVCSSSKIVYKCDFGYPGSNEDCFAEIDDYAVVPTFPMTHDRKIIGALSDVSSISLLIKKKRSNLLSSRKLETNLFSSRKTNWRRKSLSNSIPKLGHWSRSLLLPVSTLSNIKNELEQMFPRFSQPIFSLNWIRNWISSKETSLTWKSRPVSHRPVWLCRKQSTISTFSKSNV